MRIRLLKYHFKLSQADRNRQVHTHLRFEGPHCVTVGTSCLSLGWTHLEIRSNEVDKYCVKAQQAQIT